MKDIFEKLACAGFEITISFSEDQIDVDDWIDNFTVAIYDPTDHVTYVFHGSSLENAVLELKDSDLWCSIDLF